jgi:hypothetical protein
MSLASKVAESASRLALTFSWAGFLWGLLVMSPTGRFGGFVIMAACAVVPVVLGSRRYRIYGAVSLVIGLGGASLLYKDYQSDPYFVRAKMAEVFAVGSDYRTAVGTYWERHHAWPERIEDIGLQRSPQSVKTVVLEASGAIRIIASFAPLEDKSVVFVPSVSGGAIQWKCFSEDIAKVHLPSGCRQE